MHLKPKRIAITGGYHGVHNTIRVYNQSRDVAVPIIDLDDGFKEGDIAWVETPLNPTGEARDIQYYSDKVRNTFSSILKCSDLSDSWYGRSGTCPRW